MRSVLIIAGPSAVGKTSVVTSLIKSEPGFELVRSATTRAARGDAYDSEYIYLSRAEFEGSLATGNMLEHTEYGGNLYGTPRSEIERIFSLGKTPLLILDISGVRALKARHESFGVVSICLWDDPAVLEKRLAERYFGAEGGEDKLASRLSQNRKDYAAISLGREAFDSFIKNESIPETAAAVLSEFSRLSSGGARDSEKINAVADILKKYAK